MRPITTVDYIRFFGEYPRRTIRGYSFIKDGEILAVFGALLSSHGTMLFSDIKDGAKASPIVVWRLAKKALKTLDDMKQPIYATSDKSGKFLLSLGFAFCGDTKYGKLYQYLG